MPQPFVEHRAAFKSSVFIACKELTDKEILRRLITHTHTHTDRNKTDQSNPVRSERRTEQHTWKGDEHTMFLHVFHLTPEKRVPEHQLNTSVPEALENPQEETWAAELQAENSPSAHMQRIHSLATGDHGGSSPDKSSQVSIRRCLLTSLLQACRSWHRLPLILSRPLELYAVDGSASCALCRSGCQRALVPALSMPSFPTGRSTLAPFHLCFAEKRALTLSGSGDIALVQRHCFGPGPSGLRDGWKDKSEGQFV